MMMIRYSMRSRERNPCKAPEETKFEYNGDLLTWLLQGSDQWGKETEM